MRTVPGKVRSEPAHKVRPGSDEGSEHAFRGALRSLRRPDRRPVGAHGAHAETQETARPRRRSGHALEHLAPADPPRPARHPRPRTAVAVLGRLPSCFPWAPALAVHLRRGELGPRSAGQAVPDHVVPALQDQRGRLVAHRGPKPKESSMPRIAREDFELSRLRLGSIEMISWLARSAAMRARMPRNMTTTAVKNSAMPSTPPATNAGPTHGPGSHRRATTPGVAGVKMPARMATTPHLVRRLRRSERSLTVAVSSAMRCSVAASWGWWFIICSKRGTFEAMVAGALPLVSFLRGVGSVLEVRSCGWAGALWRRSCTVVGGLGHGPRHARKDRGRHLEAAHPVELLGAVGVT